MFSRETNGGDSIFRAPQTNRLGRSSLSWWPTTSTKITMQAAMNFPQASLCTPRATICPQQPAHAHMHIYTYPSSSADKPRASNWAHVRHLPPCRRAFPPGNTIPSQSFLLVIHPQQFGTGVTRPKKPSHQVTKPLI